MALDPSIALGVKPVQIESPINQMAKMYEMQNIVQSNKLNQMKMDEYTRGVAETEQFKNALAQANDETAIRNAFYAKGDVKGYNDYLKSLGEQKKLDIETTNLGYTGKKTQGEIAKQRQDYDNQAKRNLSFNSSNENVIAWGQDAVLSGVYTKEEVDRVTAQLLAMPLPERQAYLAGQGATAGDLSTAATAKAGQAITMRGQDITAATAKAGQAVTLRGQNLVNERELEKIGIEKGKSSPDYIARKAELEQQGKQTAKFKAAAPAAIKTGEEAIANIDAMIGDTTVTPEGKIKYGKVAPHSGFKSAVGMGTISTLGIPGVAQYTPGSAATDFKSRFDQLKGAAFLQAYDTLRGGGAITEIEGTKAENAKTRMNLAQSEPEFIAAARDFQAALKDMVKSNKATLAKGSAGDNVDANNPLLK
jgi:hypothetical protein